MPFYMFQCCYTQQAIKAMIANPTDRKAAAAGLAESLGGKVHHFFFAFGSHDVVAIAEMPDDKAMAALSMVVAGSGAISGATTTRLLSSEDAMAAMRAASGAMAGYKPPTS